MAPTEPGRPPLAHVPLRSSCLSLSPSLHYFGALAFSSVFLIGSILVHQPPLVRFRTLGHMVPGVEATIVAAREDHL